LLLAKGICRKREKEYRIPKKKKKKDDWAGEVERHTQDKLVIRKKR